MDEGWITKVPRQGQLRGNALPDGAELPLEVIAFTELSFPTKVSSHPAVLQKDQKYPPQQLQGQEEPIKAVKPFTISYINQGNSTLI